MILREFEKKYRSACGAVAKSGKSTKKRARIRARRCIGIMYNMQKVRFAASAQRHVKRHHDGKTGREEQSAEI